MLVDEYDNFANTVLAHHGERAYRSLTHGGGFYRNFFATLKAGAERSGGGLERLFITGVSPVTMDDVTSGFNIGSNLSLKLEFNDMLGFTEAEVRGLLETYRDHGVLDQDVDVALEERMIQGFLAAYLGVAPHFVCHTERELNKGYADVCLEPLVAQYPELCDGYGYVIELEYLKRSESASEARVAAAVGEATAQLRQYLADERLARQYPTVRFIGLAVVFHGWELAFCDAVAAGCIMDGSPESRP